MLKVLIDLRVDDEGLKRLKELPHLRVELIDKPEEEGRRPLPAKLLADVDMLACSIPPSNLEDMRSLRFVQIASSGYTQLVGLGLSQRGVRASNALGVFDVPIAEWNIAMMINLLRDLRGMIRNQEQGVWDRDIRFQREIRGLTVGFWGYGGIARETARLAKSLGMKVHVLARNGVKPRTDSYQVTGTGDPNGVLPDQVFTMAEKDEFLGALDFLVLAMPLTDASRASLARRSCVRCGRPHMCLTRHVAR